MKQFKAKNRTNILKVSCVKRVTACALSVVLLIVCCPLAFAEEEQRALSPEELSQMTDEEIKSLSTVQSDATLERIAQAFVDNDKETFLAYLESLHIISLRKENITVEEPVMPFEDDEGVAPLWTSDYDKAKDGEYNQKTCHESITIWGYITYLVANNKLFPNEPVGFTVSDMQILAQNAGFPDDDLEQAVGSVYVGHFYDPDTGENYIGSTTNTAKTNAQKYYDNAVTYYRQGKRDEAMKNLSYSLHYIQDMGEPHHAANVISLGPLSEHYQFEELAAECLYLRFPEEITVDDFTYDINVYRQFLNRSVGDSAHAIATVSKAQEPKIGETTDAGREILARLLLVETMVNTSCIMNKFAIQVL